MHWQLPTGPLDLSGPLFIGILNVTPDSFSDGGLYLAASAALDQAQCLVDSGVHILDLGAESTRPGAESVSPKEEWRRLEPVLKALRHHLPKTPLSVDTRHTETARRALEMGISILNDVTGFSDPQMLALAQSSDCGLIAMRSRRKNGVLLMPPYDKATQITVDPIIDELIVLKNRIRNNRIDDQRVILDPGFGFGTTFQEDLALWKALPQLPKKLEWPVEQFCIGISRKRFLACRAGRKALPPLERDALTAQAHQEAFAWGYRNFRTHRAKLEL